MADRYAVASTAWSLLSTWNGGASLPASGDDVYSNNFFVPIDQDITVNTLRNSTGSGINAGGGFTITDPSSRVVTIAASSSNQGGGSGSALVYVYGAGTLTVNGLIAGGPLNGRYGLWHDSSVTVTVNGSLTGGSHAGGYGCFVSATSAILTVNGTVQGATGPGVYQSGSSARLTVVGSVIGGTGTSGPGVLLAAGAGRFDADLVYSAFAPPIQNSVAVQFVRDGASLAMTAPSDDNWPVATGATITVEAGEDNSPAPADVRDGTLYGPGDALEGTLAVPPAEAVSVGVPVDDTVGTAALKLSDIAAVTGAQIAAALA